MSIQVLQLQLTFASWLYKTVYKLVESTTLYNNTCTHYHCYCSFLDSFIEANDLIDSSNHSDSDIIINPLSIHTPIPRKPNNIGSHEFDHMTTINHILVVSMVIKSRIITNDNRMTSPMGLSGL